MIIPLSIIGIDTVYFNHKIKLAFFEIVGIKKHIPGKIRKMTSGDGVKNPGPEDQAWVIPRGDCFIKRSFTY
jgi:hypothetical protein